MASEFGLSLAIGNTIHIDGADYQIHPWTWKMAALLERWEKNQIWDEIVADRNDISADDYAERFRLVTKTIVPQCYNSNSESKPVLDEKKRFEYQVFLRVAFHHPGLSSKTVSRWLDDPKLFAEIVEKIEEMEHDPRPAHRAAKKASVPVPFRSICAILCGEPYWMSLEQIANLTPFQTDEILFHPRHSEGEMRGSVQLPEEKTGPDDLQGLAEKFGEECKAKGMTEEQTSEAWFEKLVGLVG